MSDWSSDVCSSVLVAFIARSVAPLSPSSLGAQRRGDPWETLHGRARATGLLRLRLLMNMIAPARLPRLSTRFPGQAAEGGADPGSRSGVQGAGAEPDGAPFRHRCGCRGSRIGALRAAR